MKKYSGTAKNNQNQLIGKAQGTIQEISNWADNIIRAEGECSITIVPIFDEEIKRYWEAKHAGNS